MRVKSWDASGTSVAQVRTLGPVKVFEGSRCNIEAYLHIGGFAIYLPEKPWLNFLSCVVEDCERLNMLSSE
jgi:hypothetical protein